MSVLTLPAQPGQDTAPRPVPWRRMAWVTWRQQRATLISVPAVLGAVAVFLVIFGLKVHHDYAALVHCPLDAGAAIAGLRQSCSAISTPPTGRWQIPARS